MKFLSTAIIILSVILNAGQSLAMARMSEHGPEHIKALVEAYKAHRSQPFEPRTDVPLQAKPRVETRCSRSSRAQARCVKISVVIADGKMFELVANEAEKVGVCPVTMYSMEVHESANYRSKLWREGFNPAGIEYRNFPGINCWRNPRNSRWAAFGSAEDGIRAHAYVLSNRRYDGARATSDPYAQVDAIGRAGYCEKFCRAGWLSGIKSNIRRFAGLFTPKHRTGNVD